MDSKGSHSAESIWPSRLAVAATAVVTGICVGVGAGALQVSGMALVAIQSLVAGAIAGFVLSGATSSGRFGRPTWRAALLAAAVAVVTQHVWLYQSTMEARREARARQPAVDLFRPGWAEQSFFEYMRSEANWQTVSLWLLDACLMSATAVAIVERGNRAVRREAE